MQLSNPIDHYQVFLSLIFCIACTMCLQLFFGSNNLLSETIKSSICLNMNLSSQAINKKLLSSRMNEFYNQNLQLSVMKVQVQERNYDCIRVYCYWKDM